MRLAFFFAALTAALGIAAPAAADRYVINLGAATIAVPTCGSGGGSAVTLPAGAYILQVSGEDAALCQAATCASGGVTFVVGTQIPIWNETERSVSCRSTGGTALVQFIKADRG